VSLFDQGLLVPPRTKDSTSYVDLSDAELTKILNADVTSWRWEVRFLPQYDNGVKVTTYDALNNTDYLKMNSWIHIEGVNSVDAIMNAF
jgi:hypothetical protein